MSMSKFRHELKFVINYYQYENLKRLLAPIMEKDKNALSEKGYLIRSLYFDDYYNTAVSEKLSGVFTRKKYRIRIYDYSDRVIKLECKHKYGAYIYKEAVNLTHGEYENIIKNDLSFLLKKDSQVAQEFYIDSKIKMMRPSVLVDYERDVFTLQTGDVRITFDQNIRTGYCKTDIFDSTSCSYMVMEPDELILEVKFTGLLPEMLRPALSGKFVQTAASKYVLCKERMNTIKN